MNKDSLMSIKPISTPNAPKAIGPYSQGMRAGDFLFCSGQVALDPKTGELMGQSAAEQAARALENLRAVIEAAGGNLSQVVRTTIFLIDLGDFSSVNETYGKFFPSNPPARSTVGVASLPRGARVEIDAICYLGK
ncbi:MAG: RidA family protein [Bdellovibrionota bacterium]